LVIGLELPGVAFVRFVLARTAAAYAPAVETLSNCFKRALKKSRGASGDACTQNWFACWMVGAELASAGVFLAK
jgi:hypothetical protein